MRKEVVLNYANNTGKAASKSAPWGLLYMGIMLLSKFTIAPDLPLWAALLPIMIILGLIAIVLAGCAIFLIGVVLYFIATIISEVAKNARRSARSRS